jgi:hypothetical protein
MPKPTGQQAANPNAKPPGQQGANPKAAKKAAKKKR